MKIAVIMSTYNGEKYLTEQIDSILAQQNVDIELFIRDDGSIDKTVKIIMKYCEKYPNIHLEKGINIGFGQSFMSELKKAKGFDFYAFSDQDDYWEKEKLFSACNMVLNKGKNEQKPIVYYSNLNVADENLNIYRKTELEKRKHSIESVVMRRSIAGCTMVFNQAMWDCINMKSTTDEMLRRGHDSFIISLCYAVGGEVLCDSNAYICYRQHKSNTSGSSYGVLKRVKKEWNILINRKGAESEIARSILENWSRFIEKDNKKVLLIVSNSNEIGNRMKILMSGRFATGDLRLTLVGKFKVITGLL